MKEGREKGRKEERKEGRKEESYFTFPWISYTQYLYFLFTLLPCPLYFTHLH
jgi:hypothetical protein